MARKSTSTIRGNDKLNLAKNKRCSHVAWPKNSCVLICRTSWT